MSFKEPSKILPNWQQSNPAYELGTYEERNPDLLNGSIYTWPHKCLSKIDIHLRSSITALYANLTEFTSMKATEMCCILFIIS